MARTYLAHCICSAIQRASVLLVLVTTFLAIPINVSADYVHLRLVEPDGLDRFFMSPDGKHIVYTVITEVDEEPAAIDLYSMRIAGGRRIRLAHVTTTDRDISLAFQISPDSSRVVFEILDYRKYEYVTCRDSLHSVPISGGQTTRIDRSASPEQNKCINWQITPDSNWVVYQETVENDTGDGYYRNLYSVPITGGTPILLNPAFDEYTDIGYGAFLISPDSAYVVFAAEGQAGGLYIIPVDGGETAHHPCPQDLPEIDQVSISADSGHVVVMCRWFQFYEIYGYPSDGGTPIRLSAPYELQLSPVRYLLSSAGNVLVYRKWDDVAKRHAIVSHPVSGGAPIELAIGDDPIQAVEAHALTPDGGNLLYSRGKGNGAVLYSTPTSHSAPVRLMDLPSEWNWSFSFTPDGTLAILQRGHPPEMMSGSSELREDVPALMSVPVTGGPVTVLVESDSDVRELQFSPDGSRILHVIDGDSLLYAVSTDGGTPTLIAKSVADFDITPNEVRIVYQTWNTGLYLYTPGTNQFLPSIFGP